MRFRDSRQKALVCSALMSDVGLPDVWGAQGPRGEAWRAPAGAGGDAGVVLQVCWAIWGDVTTFPFSDLGRLEPRRLQAIGELLVASARGVEAVDAWLAARGAAGPPHPPAVSARSTQDGRAARG